MQTAYFAVTLIVALMVAFSGAGKIRRDPKIVRVIQDVVGVPLKYFAPLAACEFAGALGLIAGIWWPSLGVAAGIGLVVYFLGAVIAHLRVGDFKGIGPAAFMLAAAAGALALRIFTMRPAL
jgi:DoxX-like family